MVYGSKQTGEKQRMTKNFKDEIRLRINNLGEKLINDLSQSAPGGKGDEGSGGS